MGMMPRAAPRLAAGKAWAVRLRNNEAAMRIAANTGWLLGDRLVRAALGFLVGAWVARYLGPEQFGQYAYMLAFIAFFQAVATLGLDSIVVRDVARDPGSAPEVLGSALRLRVVSGILCWGLAVAVAAMLAPGDHQAIAMTAIAGGILLFQAADTVDLWFQSQTQSRRTVVAKLIAYLMTNGLKIILVLTGAPLIAFAAAFALDFAAAAVALTVAYRRYPTQRRWQFKLRDAKALLRQSWPFMLSGLSIIVYMRIDQIMLKSFYGDRELGIYAAALPLSQLWQMIPITVAVSLAPMVARHKLEGEVVYRQTLLGIFRLFGVISCLLSIFMAAVAPFVIPIIYGPSYSETILVLQIHVFSNIFIALGIAQNLWAANEQRGKTMLVKTVCGGLFAVAGNLAVIPIWGAAGAATVSVASQAVAAVLSNLILAPDVFWMQLGLQRDERAAHFK